MTRAFLFAAAVALAMLAGCIVSDQVTTITILPDGSADWVRFQSNIRSSEAGAKGAEELKRFVEEFDARRDPDQLRIKEVGGEVLESRWLRKAEPHATLVVARLPSARALEDYATFKDDKGEVVARARFTQAEKRRRFSIEIPVPKEEKAKEAAPEPSIEDARKEQANGISETRIAVAGGRIVDSRGFTVAADGRSALLEPRRIEALLREAGEKLEIFLEWEIVGG
jgi:hypothetical protein